MPPVIQTTNLTRVYPGAQPVTALDDVSLTIESGEFLSIIGPSGSGKSTLMNVLGLLDTATSGQLLYKGQDVTHWNHKQKALFRNEEIGFIFQAHMLMTEFTALENILMPVRIGKRFSPEQITKAEKLLERIGLAGRTHHKPSELSGGQNQRVAIARALMNTPSVVFADEPTGALDYQTSNEVYELLREIGHADGVTFVIVTHEQNLSAKTDRVISLLDGKLASDERQN